MLKKYLNTVNICILVAVAWSLLLLSAFYPGMLYSDSFPRWQLAKAIWIHGLNYDFRLLGLTDHHPVVPAILMSGFFAISREVGFFIFAQALGFYSLMILLLKRLLFSNFQLAAALTLAGYVLLPHVWMYSIYHSFDSVATVLIGLLAFFMIQNSKDEAVSLSFAKVSVILITLFLLLSFRLTAIAVAPLVGWHLIRHAKGVLPKSLMLLSVVIMTALPYTTSYWLQLERRDSMAVGLAWELLGMMKAVDVERYSAALDITGVSTAKAMEETCPHGIWCGSETDLALAAGESVTAGQVVKKSYLNFARTEPMAFLKYKVTITLSLLGITRPLMDGEIGRESRAAQMKDYGFEWNDRQQNLIQIYRNYMKIAGSLILRPWLMFIIAGFMCFAQYILRRDRRYLGIFALAIAFYLGFVVTSQNHELRYFYPSLHLLILVIVGGILDLGSYWRVNKSNKVAFLSNIRANQVERMVQSPEFNKYPVATRCSASHLETNN